MKKMKLELEKKWRKFQILVPTDLKIWTDEEGGRGGGEGGKS